MFEQEIARVTADLQRLVGVPLADVWQPARDRLVVGFRDGTLVLIVPRGPSARLHSVSSRPENPPKPFSFQGLCRSRLAGPLTALAQTPGEREVHLGFGDLGLRLRLTGRSGGLWLVAGDQVLGSSEGPCPPELPPLPARTPCPDPPRFGPVDGSWDLGARAWFTEQESRAALGRLRDDARRALSERARRDGRLLDALRGDLERTREAGALRRRAELLSGNLWRVPRGAATVDVEDWDTGAPVVLTWSPGMPAPAAAERWFAQARRLEGARGRLVERIGQLEEALGGWTAATSAVAEADEAQLRRWVGERPRPARRARGPWIEWTDGGGRRLRVGRDEAGNRRLVFQASRGHHVWMHLRDRPSAHVVLPLERGTSAALSHLLAGAQVLLDRAGVGNGEVVEVQYAWVRDVRPVPGTVSTVTVGQEKVLRVTSDPAALAGWDRVAEDPA